MLDKHDNLALQVHEHAEFVRKLAARLVHDPDAAADVAQESLMTALQAKANVPRNSVRQWLSGVVRNKALRHFRSESRRHEREKQALKSASAEIPGEALTRFETRQDLIQKVSNLSEPYRTVILLRYMDNQLPQEIAQALGRPVSSVKTQLQRGLALLREALDADENGDRRAWVLALAPIADPNLISGLGSGLGGSLAAQASQKVLVSKSYLVVAAGITALATSAMIYSWSGSSEDDTWSELSKGQAELAIDKNSKESVRRPFAPKSRDSKRPLQSELGTSPSVVLGPTGSASAATGEAMASRARIIDAETKEPIAGARVLEILRDSMRSAEDHLAEDIISNGVAREAIPLASIETISAFGVNEDQIQDFLSKTVGHPSSSDDQGWVTVPKGNSKSVFWLVSKEGFQSRHLQISEGQGLPPEIPLRPAGSLIVSRSEALDHALSVYLRSSSQLAFCGRILAGHSRAVFKGLPPGEWSVEAVNGASRSAQSLKSSKIRFNAQATVMARRTVLVELGSPVETNDVEVQVRGLPAESKDYFLRLESASPWIMEPIDSSGLQDGRTTLAAVPAGEYRLVLGMKRGGKELSLTTRLLTVKAGDAPNRVVFDLPRVQLRVNFSEASRDSGWHLTLVSSEQHRQLKRQDGGQWTLDHLVAGPAMLIAHHGNKMFRHQLEVSEDMETYHLRIPKLHRILVTHRPEVRISLETCGIKQGTQDPSQVKDGKVSSLLLLGDGHFHIEEHGKAAMPRWLCVDVEGHDQIIDFDSDFETNSPEVTLSRRGEILPWTKFSLRCFATEQGEEPMEFREDLETDSKGHARVRHWPREGRIVVTTEAGDTKTIEISHTSTTDRKKSITIDLP